MLPSVSASKAAPGRPLAARVGLGTSLVLGAALLLATATSGCLSYAVGTTAQPLPRGEMVTTDILEVVPFVPPDLNCTDRTDRPEQCDEPQPVRPNLSTEIRYGLDERSDVGVRLIGYSGFVASYKRLVSPDSAALDVAFLGGAGLINLFQHAEVEATLIVSKPARPDAPAIPYGGIRLMQAIRLSTAVPRDLPTVGVFAGARLGTSTFRVSPELGVFYDRSALNPDRSPLLIVPSFTVVGSGILARLIR